MNLLLNNDDWTKTAVFYEDASHYVGNIYGGYAAFPTGEMLWAGSTIDPVNDRLTATVNWGLEVPPDGGEVWFLVLLDGVVVFAEQLIYVSDITEGSFEIDILAAGTPSITTSGSPTDLYPQVNAYDQIGWFDITPTTEPVEQQLPWWYCAPAEAPTPCPVRPTTFVPFDEYDADFKYPLASSRVPSKIPVPEGCVTCSADIEEITCEDPPIDPPEE